MKFLKTLNNLKGLIICILLWALMIAVWVCAEPSPLDDITFGGVVFFVVGALILMPVVIWLANHPNALLLLLLIILTRNEKGKLPWQ